MGGKSSRRLSEEGLRLAPELLGAELASPWRRALAFVLDWILVLVPTLALSVGVAAIALRVRDPAGYRAIRTVLSAEPEDPEVLRLARRDLAPILVEMEAPGLPTEVRLAVERGDLDAAAEGLSGCDFMIALALGEHEEIQAKPGLVTIRVERLIPKPIRWLVLFGVAALYFTLFGAGRRGATLGKRLLGIRVVALEGGRLHLLESFERFAGYLEIPVTFGLAFLPLWRDANRRMPHDRVASTAVVRSRKPQATSAPPEPAEQPPAEELPPIEPGCKTPADSEGA